MCDSNVLFLQTVYTDATQVLVDHRINDRKKSNYSNSSMLDAEMDAATSSMQKCLSGMKSDAWPEAWSIYRVGI